MFRLDSIHVSPTLYMRCVILRPCVTKSVKLEAHNLRRGVSRRPLSRPQGLIDAKRSLHLFKKLYSQVLLINLMVLLSPCVGQDLRLGAVPGHWCTRSPTHGLNMHFSSA